MTKTLNELEKERKQKLFFNEVKKWNFEDFIKHQDKKNKYLSYIAMIFILLILGNYLAIIFGTLYWDSRDKIEIRNTILINEAEKR